MAATLRTIFIALVMLLISTGQGLAQWELTNGPSGSGYIRCSYILKDGSTFFAGTWGGGVFLSTDGGTNWTATNNGLTNKYVSSLLKSGIHLFVVTDAGIFVTTDNGANWAQANNGITNQANSITLAGTNLFAGTFNSGIFLSTDNGAIWNPSGLSNLGVNTIAVSGSNIFAGAFSYSDESGVFLSSDNGASWTKMNNGLSDTMVTSLAVSGTNLFANVSSGSGTKVYVSANDGDDWNEANNGLPNTSSLFAVSGSNVFAGTYGDGVFLTTDNGTSWVDVNSPSFNKFINALAVIDEYIYAGTFDGGVYRRPLSQIITAVDDYSNIPVEFNLAQNYPNPFNPSTIIRYSVPNVPLSGVEGSRVQLRVYDVLGTEVATLVNEEKPAGSYEVEFSSKGLSSGIYLYKIKQAVL